MAQFRYSVAGGLVGLLFAAVMASPAASQDSGDDWDLREDPTRGMALATLEYENAPALAVRCLGHELTLIMTGLPVGAVEAEDLSIALQGVPLPGRWATLADGRTAGSWVSGMTVREMMSGGEILLTVGGETPRRYRLTAPARSSALAAVLTRCGQPAVYARDAERLAQRAARGGIEPRLVWRRRPTAEFPSLAASRGVEFGVVHVTCRVLSNGRMEACEVESEAPESAGFGKQALDGFQDATLDMTAPGAPTAGEVVGYSARFRLSQ